MRTSSLFTLSAAVASVAATPFRFPLADGFPNPSPDQLAKIQYKAQGSLPNAPLPTNLKSDGVTTLQLIAMNELFEVAYFTELLYNITKGKPGYESRHIPADIRAYVVDALKAVVNQEKLHALGVNGILKSAGQTPVEPCQYEFPVSNFGEAMLLAQTFTDVVLGTLPQAQAIFSNDAGDESPLVPLLGSVIAQEGEQNGFYRATQRKTPSAAPFLTGGAPEFAFTALQTFIVPGSCPQPLTNVNLKTFEALKVVTKKPEAKNQQLEFEVSGHVNREEYSIVYLSGQNLPLTVPVEDVTHHDSETRFTANFPFEEGFASGLTIAAVVKGSGPFESNQAVARATVFGPGLIEIN